MPPIQTKTALTDWNTRRVAAPDSSPARFGLYFSFLELTLQCFVEGVLCDARAEAGADQFFIQTPIIDVNVGQQSLVSIALIFVEFQCHHPPFYLLLSEGRGFRSEWFDRLSRVFCFRCIHANQAHFFVSLKHQSIAVNDSHDPDYTIRIVLNCARSKLIENPVVIQEIRNEPKHNNSNRGEFFSTSSQGSAFQTV